MSSTGSYAASGDPVTRPMPAARAGNPLAAMIILALFVLAAVISAERKDITQGFDEVAHTSYVAFIQQSGDPWPALDGMKLLDPRSFEFTGDGNYLNHPPIFYALLAALGPNLIGHPPALMVFRLIDAAIAACGFAVLLWLGLAARLSRNEFYAYAVPLACIPVLVPLAGAVNNDDPAFLGGALILLGLWQVVATEKSAWLGLALLGMIVAAWVKLTGLLLTGAMVSAVLGYLLWRRRLTWGWSIAAGLAFALAAAPYVVFFMQYGSPAPNTPAQIALLESGAHTAGWADLPRMSFPAYLGYFILAFVADWMPALGPRSVLNYAMLAAPIGALGCAAAGLALSLRRLWRRRETALDVTVIAGAAAIAATFAVHVSYSYGRHLATGWLMDAYPRYYLPLVVIVPLAGLSLLAAVESPRWRGALLSLLIGGPIVFRLLGAPLG